MQSGGKTKSTNLLETDDDGNNTNQEGDYKQR
jgi:hypothetical protein